MGAQGRRPPARGPRLCPTVGIPRRPELGSPVSLRFGPSPEPLPPVNKNHIYIGSARLNQLRFMGRDPILTGILKVDKLPVQP